MKRKRTTLIAVASGLVCAACVLAFMYTVKGEADVARSEALARYGGEQVEVCVATRDIAAGERVDASCVESKTYISDLLPSGSVTSADDVVGKTTTSSICQGEVITEKRFETNGVSLDVPAGKVAVSLPAKTASAVGGAIAAGMYVDVYASGDASTSMIAEDVLVLDTSLASGSASSTSAWVTVAVDQEAVQELISACERTDLYFALPSERAVLGGGQETE